MTFDEVLDQVRELLQSKGRVAYRALKRRFELNDEYLEDLKAELIDAEHVAVDEDGKVLVWTGKEVKAEAEERGNGEAELGPTTPPADAQTKRLKDSRHAAGERRQLTVMFIDLVGSTVLSQQLDPEEYHAHVVAYQNACRSLIGRYEGYVAQYLGDGILAYFGYPAAHEDDAARAIRSGLECVTAVNQLPYSPPLQVRIGVHTGPVMVGEIGAGERTEMLALGETPNLAARVQGVAEPNTVFLSPVTQRLVQGLFKCQDRGLQTLKGIATPLALYRVIGESTARSRFEAAVQTGLTPLVGREEELGLLQRRWEQAKIGAGQVVLLSGEPGIGKSRLVQELKEQVNAEGATHIEFRCSPYHQNSALYPITEHLQRLLQFQAAETPQAKLGKLTQLLSQYRFPRPETLPLLAALFSFPPPEDAAPLSYSPQKQKQLTLEALVAWLLEEAERAAVYCAWEDLHWADPSTVEALTLLLDQIPTTRLMAVLTFRPEFTPPWGNRSHLSQLTLSRLGRSQVETMVGNVTGENALPPEVVQQIVAKTDGVPLFVEELTKNVVEQHVGTIHESPLQLGIPATLQDALMARLDRLNEAKAIAQLGATVGREFSYELLHAVSPLDEDSLQQGLRQLVEAELIYQRGLLPRATYLFKHALIQDTAYQSLLKSRRQQLHQQIARVLDEQLPNMVETQPELIAHHYTEAGLIAQAIPYWQKAGEHANQRSAYKEAVAHLLKGLELLKVLPETLERARQELALQSALGTILTVTKGYGAAEVEQTYARARTLCQQVGETPQLFPVLFGLYTFHYLRAELYTARELAEQVFRLAESLQDPALLLWPHGALGLVLYNLGELTAALAHLEQGIALYDPQKHRPHGSQVSGQDPKVTCLSYAAYALWHLGYPDQARKKMAEMLTLAQELSHPFSSAFALSNAAVLDLRLRDVQAVQERSEALLTLSREQGFPFWLAWGTNRQGWVLVEQGQGKEGIGQMRQGLTTHLAMGTQLSRPASLALLAEAYSKVGQGEEGLTLLAEALVLVDKTGDRSYVAELYRLKGELLLQQARKLSD